MASGGEQIETGGSMTMLLGLLSIVFLVLVVLGFMFMSVLVLRDFVRSMVTLIKQVIISPQTGIPLFVGFIALVVLLVYFWMRHGQ
jgi:hypothetical protein